MLKGLEGFERKSIRAIEAIGLPRLHGGDRASLAPPLCACALAAAAAAAQCVAVSVACAHRYIYIYPDLACARPAPASRAPFHAFGGGGSLAKRIAGGRLSIRGCHRRRERA